MANEPLALPESWSPRSLSAIRRALLTWFDRNQRELPWRTNRDPYRIWVSEAMLQQTTVAAVVPYFDRFVAAFPNVQSLAAAEEADVLRLWEGLGYYRRARHLHATARRIVAEHGGRFPDDPVAWADFPGVGRYMVGAILSQAFDRQLPIVEANSLRVLARLFGYEGDPRVGDGKAWVWLAAEAVLPRSRVGDFNQAIMELGALVCSPREPDCGRCPLAMSCIARRTGRLEAIPPPKPARSIERVREVAVAIRSGGKYLVARRPADSKRWADLWEFPHAEWPDGEELETAAVRVARELTGLSVRLGGELATIRHSVTRFTIAMTGVSVERIRGRERATFHAELRWVAPADLAELPTSSPQRRLFREADSARSPGLFE
jgi:A/G-specific adenine glycosylase